MTVRVKDVEQVFYSQGGGIAFADLTQQTPSFIAVSLVQVQALNALVGAMIRYANLIGDGANGEW